jgi:hypothetical protein
MLPHPFEAGGSAVEEVMLVVLLLLLCLLRCSDDVVILPTVFMAIHHDGDVSPSPLSDGIVDDDDMLLYIERSGAQSQLFCSKTLYLSQRESGHTRMMLQKKKSRKKCESSVDVLAQQWMYYFLSPSIIIITLKRHSAMVLLVDRYERIDNV